MKTIKIAFYKVEVINLRNSLQLYSFEDLIRNLAIRLHGDKDIQVIEEKDGLETSIWFDYLNNPKEFGLEKEIYFLLAKDIKSIMKEDKENKKLAHEEVYQDNIRLKIPSHFVYFPDRKILGVEEITDAPTKNVIKRAIKKHEKIDLKITPINRENILDRLITFKNAIESVEFEMKYLSEVMKNSEPNSWTELVSKGKNGKLKVNMYEDKGKEETVSFFSRLLKSRRQPTAEEEIFDYIENMKVSFKNENSLNEIVELINNFLVFKQERDIYLDDINHIKDNVQKRIEYSKSIYKTIIGLYNDYFNNGNK